MSKLNYKHETFGERMDCPGCDGVLKFWRNADLDVNVHSRKKVEVLGMKILSEGCKNPMCEWSKVDGIWDEVKKND